MFMKSTFISLHLNKKGKRKNSVDLNHITKMTKKNQPQLVTALIDTLITSSDVNLLTKNTVMRF